jgi:hypothetical protein
MAIKPEDDLSHDPKAWGGEWNKKTHWWNESGWFNFHIPEKEISGIFYVHHRPENNFMYAGTALWDPHGDQSENCLFYDWNVHIRPDDAQPFTFELPNSLKFECLEPMKKFRFSYDNDGYQALINWEAYTPPQDQADRGIPKEWIDWCPGHYEQFGRATGEVTINGETHQVNTFAARDRSFGPHRMTYTGRGTFTWAVVDETHGVFPYIVAKEPVPTDPIWDTVDLVKGGWYMRDGEITTLVSGERRTLERDDQGRPWKEVIEAKDEKGREIHMEGEVKNHLFFQGFPEYWWWWCLTDWKLDGKQAWGETQDAAIAPHWRRIMYDRNKAKRLAAAS